MGLAAQSSPPSSDGPEAARSVALDLHEGICDLPAREPFAPPVHGGCQRWPENLRLVSDQGEFVRGRCAATNLCRYCQRLYVVETVEMLTIDAMEYAPTLWGVLTAREHLTRTDCYGHLRQLRKKLRKTWPDVEWFVQVEFQRRGALHLNLLIKGVPVVDRAEVERQAVSLWCERVDARPVGQWFGVVQDGVGVVKYLSKMLAHGLKAEQAPPIGWKGHRTSQTRGYLVRPASKMRLEARESLRYKRHRYRIEQLGVSAQEAHDYAVGELERDALKSWWIAKQLLPVREETVTTDTSRWYRHRVGH